MLLEVVLHLNWWSVVLLITKALLTWNEHNHNIQCIDIWPVIFPSLVLLITQGTNQAGKGLWRRANGACG